MSAAEAVATSPSTCSTPIAEQMRRTRRLKLTIRTQSVLLCAFLALTWAFGKCESTFDLRTDLTRSAPLYDIGFELTAPLQRYLRANPMVHDVLAFANTAFVGLCYAYGLAYAYIKMQPAIVVSAVLVYAIRLMVGFCTQLPVHPEYLHSAYDFPDIIHGENINFFFFYSGHAAIASLVVTYLVAPRGPLRSAWFVHVLNALQCVRMLATRGHYSIDLIVGIAAGLITGHFAEDIDDWVFAYVKSKNL